MQVCTPAATTGAPIFPLRGPCTHPQRAQGVQSLQAGQLGQGWAWPVLVQGDLQPHQLLGSCQAGEHLRWWGWKGGAGGG